MFIYLLIYLFVYVGISIYVCEYVPRSGWTEVTRLLTVVSFHRTQYCSKGLDSLLKAYENLFLGISK